MAAYVSVTYGVHHQGWDLNPDDGGRMFLRNVSNGLPDYTAPD